MRYHEIIDEGTALPTGGAARHALDADAEDHRVFAAYRKKHGIDLATLSQMDDAEIRRLWADARAHRHLYRVATTEPDYLYHGTAKARLPRIAREGLIPSQRSRWARSGLTYHSLGRVFFADTIGRAEWYAREASLTRPVILRVRRDVLTDMQPDMEEMEGGYFVERRIPPDQIEM